MSDLEKAIVVKISKSGKKFELLLDREKVYAYLEKELKEPSLSFFIVEEVFKDANKGIRASKEEIVEAFQTADLLEILKYALNKGEIPITTEQRRKMVEKKKKRIIDIILRNAIDVRTNAPIPEKRLELALEEAKIRVDPFKPAEEQVTEIVKKLKLILPLKFAKAVVAFKIPAEYAMKVYGAIKRYTVKAEEWGKEGELYVVLELPVGEKADVLSKLSSLTEGNVQYKELEIKEV